MIRVHLCTILFRTMLKELHHDTIEASKAECCAWRYKPHEFSWSVFSISA